MRQLIEIFTNQSITTAIVSVFVAQIAKIPINYITKKPIDISLLWATGGMPSSHNAAIGSLVTSIFLTDGPKSTNFAIALTVAMVVFRDSVGIRLESGKHAKKINEIQKYLSTEWNELDNELLDTMLGHTFLQAVIGFILGIITTLLTLMIFYK